MTELQDSTAYMVEQLSSDLKESICNSANAPAATTAYYVSNAGNDANDGKTPATAWATVARVNSANLSSGDQVLFRRGDLWRGTTLQAVAGVTYGAFGEGAKPRLYISPCNGAETGVWTLTNTPNVYRYSLRFPADIGGLIMDGGEAWGRKVCVQYASDGSYDFRDAIAGTKTPFASYSDLKKDLDFYHDLGGKAVTDTTGNYGYIYLYSDKGNPADRWSEIEFLDHSHLVSLGTTDLSKPTVFENLALMYGGLHGISGGDFYNVTVRYCEFGFIGGAITNYGATGNPSRLGNAVESFGSSDRYTVDHCWIYQIYDAAVTHQFDASATMQNIYYTNNLIEYCTYGVEFWAPAGLSRNIHIEGNIIRRIGEGFTTDRANQIYRAICGRYYGLCTDHSIYINNNIFDRSAQSMVALVSEATDPWVGTYTNNIFIVSNEAQFGYDHNNHFFAFSEANADLLGGSGNRYYRTAA